jgi:hypothetical protein
VDDQLEGKIAISFADWLTLQQLDRCECGLFTLPHGLRGDCREFGRNVCRERQVVEPHDPTSPGTESPASRKAEIAPTAIVSLPANKAVGRFLRPTILRIA